MKTTHLKLSHSVTPPEKYSLPVREISSNPIEHKRQQEQASYDKEYVYKLSLIAKECIIESY